MLLDLELAEAPATKFIDLADAKARLKIDYADDDADLDDLVATARDWLDGYSGVLGRALITQTWKLYGESFGHLARMTHPSRLSRRTFDLAGWRFNHARAAIRLPLPPLQAVTAIDYVDPDGVDQSLDLGDVWITPGQAGEVRPIAGGSWPATQCGYRRAVTITFTAGYGDEAEAVPPRIRSAALYLVAHWNRNREAVVGVESRDSSTELPLAFRDMIRPFRLQKL